LQLISLLLAIKGQTPAQVQTLIEQVTPLLKENFKSKTLERIKEHQQAGLPLILVSAAMHQAVAYLGKEMQGRGEGTHIRQNDGRYIFKVEGGVCQGEGKAARAKAVIAELNLDASKCYAYGDTASDIPFLELFGFPCAVDPDLALEQEARQRGWPVLRNN
jgi:phosphoserine phosphatase